MRFYRRRRGPVRSFLRRLVRRIPFRLYRRRRTIRRPRRI